MCVCMCVGGRGAGVCGLGGLCWHGRAGWVCIRGRVGRPLAHAPTHPPPPAPAPAQTRPALWAAVLQPEEHEQDALERFTDALEGGEEVEAEEEGAGQGEALRRAPKQAPGAGGKKQQQRGGGGGGGRAVVARIDVGGSDEEEEEGSGEEQVEEEGGSSGSSEGEEEEEEAEEQQAQQASEAAALQAKQQQQQEEQWPSSSDGYDMRKR